MIDDLKEAKAHYIIGPTVGGKSKLEVEDKRYDAPAILERAGVEFTLTTDSHVIPMEGFLSQVAVLMKHGLTEETAYKCVTTGGKGPGSGRRAGIYRAGQGGGRGDLGIRAL